MKRSFSLLLFSAMIICAYSLVHGATDKNADTTDPAPIFFTANQAYRDGRFEQAVELYETLRARGIINGDIFYNLGNAYLKSGKIGKALVNYRRAELFMPRNEDLLANIQYVLQHTIDKIEGRDSYYFPKSFCFWYSRLSIRELIIVFLIVHSGMWSIALVLLFKKLDYLSSVLYILIGAVTIFGLSAAVKAYDIYNNPQGVVTATEMTVRSGTSNNDTALFALHEGTEFDWVEEGDGWVKLRLRDGKRGWAQKQTVEKVAIE